MLRIVAAFVFLLCSVLVPRVALAAPVTVHTDPGDLPRLEVAGVPLPLAHTEVDIEVHGFVAHVGITQTFVNEAREPIEASYVFPLPENSAVRDMRLTIGDRLIRSDVRRRDEARRVYEHARDTGHTAALLEQERPNIFTQSVANIAPGEAIEVEIEYLQTLTYDRGAYELVFPMVVGPRYHEGARDAHRISPPVAGRGRRTGHDIGLTVRLASGTLPQKLSVPTHAVTRRNVAGGVEVSLARKNEIPNRDFVMRWSVAGPDPTATLFAEGSDTAGHFSMVIHPPDLNVDRLVGKRELIFVVDVSGSMSGQPLSIAREAMRNALSRLRPVDTFDVITFAGATRRAFGRPVAANAHNLATALAVVDGLQAGGGTRIGGAVDQALTPDVTSRRHRYVVFLTDGYVSIEEEVHARARRLRRQLAARGHEARVFAIGIGSSPNWHLLSRLTQAGGGTRAHANTREAPARVVGDIFHVIDHPVVERLQADWHGWDVRDVEPGGLPDLFASHAVVVHGRYQGAPPKVVTIRGTADGRPVTIPVQIQRVKGAVVHGPLWARARIDWLERGRWFGAPAEGEITELGLRYRLVTSHTSLVAVDTVRRFADGTPTHVAQVVEAPEGVDPVMAGGNVARDFTSVVVMAATSRDAVGISLAGTSGSESRYSVEGASLNNPAFGEIHAESFRRMIKVAPSTELAHVEPYAHTWITGIHGPPTLTRGEIRSAFRDLREGIRGCLNGTDGRHFRGIAVTVTVDGDGRVLGVKLGRGKIGPDEPQRCVESNIRRLRLPPDGGRGRRTIRFRLNVLHRD